MSERYSIAEARHNLAALVHDLERQPVIELTRRGKPVAMLLSLGSYRQLLPEGESFWAAYTAFRAGLSSEELAVEPDIFSEVRERSPGRDLDL